MRKRGMKVKNDLRKLEEGREKHKKGVVKRRKVSVVTTILVIHIWNSVKEKVYTAVPKPEERGAERRVEENQRSVRGSQNFSRKGKRKTKTTMLRR